MTADGSTAVWTEQKNGAAGAQTEIHFNYWRVVSKGSFFPKRTNPRQDFVEFGVMLKTPTDIETIKIYLPGEKAWQIEDCGIRFERAEIAQGIFNKPLSSVNTIAPRRLELLYPDKSSFCRVHIFSTNNNIISAGELTQETIENGLLLTITSHTLDEVCRNLQPEVPVYFRLRAYFIGAEGSNPFVKRINPKDRFFQTGYNVVDYLDFRLNEARSLPSNVEALMRAGGSHARVQLVAFLTAVPVQSDVTTISWEKAHKKRLLEDDLWGTYAPDGIPKGMMVYHWKEEADQAETGLEDFSGFVKMQTRLVSWPVLLTSIGILFFSGIAGNLIASWLWDGTHSRTPDVCVAQCSNTWPATTSPLLNFTMPDMRQK